MNEPNSSSPDIDREIERLRARIHELESRPQASAESMPNMDEILLEIVWECDLHGRVNYVTQAGFKSFGFTPEDLAKGLSLVDMIVPEERERGLQDVANRLRGTEGELSEYTALRKDGSTFPALVRALPVVRNGEIAGLRGMILDISNQKTVEMSLRQSEERYRLLAENVSDIIWAMDLDGHYTYVSPSVESVRGFTPEEVAAGDLDQAVLPEYVPLFVDALQEELALEESGTADPNRSWTIETPLLHKDGSNIDTEIVMSFLRDPAGKPYGILGVTRDITERRRAQGELRKSETSYRLLADNVRDIIWTMDMNLRYTYISPSVLAARGYTQEEAMKFGPEDSLSPDRFEELLEILNGDLETSTDDRESAGPGDRMIEADIRRKDGSFYPAEHVITFLRDEAGNPNGILGVTRDITDRKQAEGERERFMLAIEQAAESIVVIDTAGVIHYVNPAFEQITGFTREEAIGQNILIIKSDAHEEAFYTEMWDTLARGDTWSGQTISKKKDGTLFTEEMSVTPVRDDAGTIVSYVAVKRDVTHERELEQQLLQAQKMESIGTLAGGIAHDFNNILQAMLGFIRVAQSAGRGDDELLAECLEEIETGARRAADLVDQILTFSRTSDADAKAAMLQPIVKEALRFLRSSIPSTIRIESKIDARCGQVIADGTRIHQVVTNLCTNAMHAMNDKGGTLTVSLAPVSIGSPLDTLSGTLAEGDYVELSVADTGTGVDPKVLHRLLDPFFTTKAIGQGTGLGLSMVHGIVQSMGGGLIIESEVGKGTTVRVILPALPGTQPIEQPEESPRPSRNGSGHVMVVDDEESITKLNTLILKSRGFTVDSFNDVDQALKAVQLNPNAYDVAVLDYTMPGKTGLELARDLHALNPNMPVVLVTGVLDSAKIEREKPPNVVEIVKKPFDVDELVSAVISNA